MRSLPSFASRSVATAGSVHGLAGPDSGFTQCIQKIRYMGATEMRKLQADKNRPQPERMEAATAKPDVEDIAERITNAVMEHRLPPGIKLAEERLASAFGVSRTKIRQALTVLSREGLVKLHPNRGAFVASPTVKEALDLFETRRLVEPEIVRNVIGKAGKADVKRLRAHLAAEADARARGDRR